MEKIPYPELKEYINMNDANLIQLMAENIFSNFDGGFGGGMDEYNLHQPVPNDVTIGFVTDTPNKTDLSSLTWPPNNLSLEDYRPYVKSIRFDIYHVLFNICQILDVPYSPTKDCIHTCLKTLVSKKKIN